MPKGAQGAGHQRLVPKQEPQGDQGVEHDDEHKHRGAPVQDAAGGDEHDADPAHGQGEEAGGDDQDPTHPVQNVPPQDAPGGREQEPVPVPAAHRDHARTTRAHVSSHGGGTHARTYVRTRPCIACVR